VPSRRPLPRPTSRSRDISYSDHAKAPVQEPETDPIFPTGSPAINGPIPTSRSKFSSAPKELHPDESARIRNASAHRARWEQSPEGAGRTLNVSEILGTKMPPAQIYAVQGWDRQSDSGPRVYDRQLPGMSDPNAAPRPARWEEHSVETRMHIERALAERGTSIDQMADDIGAQIDQANVRAAVEGHSGRPYAMDFYSEGEPRQVLDQSARDLGIAQPIHALMNAFTSPNTKFAHETAAGTTYPNDDAARHSVEHALRGGTSEDFSNERTDGSGKRHQGYVTNMKKAVDAMNMHLEGVQPRDWRSESGKPLVGPKTGPYANSWSDTHPQFTVGDLHTGGGGAFPHLGSDKPIMTTPSGKTKLDKQGKPKRDKSERERAIESVPFSHAAVDYAMRQAMAQRGLGSVRDSQATQWGEEQLQRGEAGLRGVPTVEKAYPRLGPTPEISGQQEMFPWVRNDPES
jgi:hypothetical protein